MIQAITWIILFTACKTNGAPADGELFDIRIKLKAGDIYSQHMFTQMNLKESILVTNTNMEEASDFEVVNLLERALQIRMTYTKLKTKLEAGGDNDAFSDSILNTINAIAVSKPMLMNLNEKRQITSVSGLEELIKTDGPVQLLETMGRAHMNNFMGFVSTLSSNKGVKVGESWNASTTMNIMGMGIIMNIKYTLTSVSDGIAEILLDGKITGQGNLRLNNEDISMELSGDQAGMLHLKIDEGYLKDCRYTMNVKAETDIMGTKIPMDLKSEYNLKGK